ncbi:MAG: CBS domain-containing protein [Acidobacteria bacterium]|uniref:CBS domain-containing protein n=1 Tax=Candidatus Polarisedimenticola svalbardensis TaxID=2886004 RepID=A0A8J7C1Q7_9BACT|nr:CBS domain-containing protein [Candidatus Polarisedimenticola svalbardensis]
MMIARDLMQVEVITVQDDTALEDVLDLLMQEHISGAPVVDREGFLVGVISQVDVFFGSRTRSGLNERVGERTEITRVKDVMTSPPICANEDTPVHDMAEMMCKLHIHRLPVVKRGRLSGMVSSIDICRAMCHGSPQAEAV